MQQLRDPKSGCEWDKKQNFQSLSMFTLEEAYEVVDAIEREDYESLKEELGDLLLQVVFYSQIAFEMDLFSFKEVTESISNKLIERHPYVFNEKQSHTQEQQLNKWEEIKFQERSKKNFESILDDLPKNLPSLMRSQKIQKRAANVGFDWNSPEGYFEKINEELAELQDAIKESKEENVQEELGDVLMSVVNLARHLNIEAEDALRKGNLKFENRFRYIESKLKEKNKSLKESSLEEMDSLWERSKQEL